MGAKYGSSYRASLWESRSDCFRFSIFDIQTSVQIDVDKIQPISIETFNSMLIPLHFQSIKNRHIEDSIIRCKSAGLGESSGEDRFGDKVDFNNRKLRLANKDRGCREDISCL